MAEEFQNDSHFVGKVLLDYAGRPGGSSLLHLLAAKLGCGEKHAERLLEASAEQSARGQQQVFEDVCSYVARIARTGDIEPQLFIHHLAVDETPLKVRIAWDRDGVSKKETGKIFVVQGTWLALLKLKRPEHLPTPSEHFSPHHLLLRGTCSPALRASEATDGESIASVVHDIFHPQNHTDGIFPRALRLVESDQAGANTRAENLYSSILSPSWRRSHFYCIARKLHVGSRRALSLMSADFVTGLTRTLLAAQDSGPLAALRRALQLLIEQRLVVCGPAPLSPPARRYRSHVLTYFLPVGNLTRTHFRVAMIASKLLNGDWRKTKTLIHHCSNCCNGRSDTAQKLTTQLLLMFTALRPAIVSKTNSGLAGVGW